MPPKRRLPAGAGPQSGICREQLPQIWQQASWLKVIEVFHLSVDHKRRRRDDEIWLKSPFTQRQQASMHVSLSANVYKDFSSGKGGGIMQFCREMLRRQGREMTMFEVAAVDGSRRNLHGEAPSLLCTRRAAAVRGNRPSAWSPITPIAPSRSICAVICARIIPNGVVGAYPPPPAVIWAVGICLSSPGANAASPLNSRLVFQIRGLRENGHDLQPIILSHSGRALSREQEDADGKYWSYPFRKGWEIYNQDQLLLDEEARRQANTFGLVLVEGFFDVAKLVEAGCRNVGALMGTHLSAEQIERLAWLRSRIRFPRIVLFLDRDQAGRNGARQMRERLRRHHFEVNVFDWDRNISWNGKHRADPGLYPRPGRHAGGTTSAVCAGKASFKKAITG